VEACFLSAARRPGLALTSGNGAFLPLGRIKIWIRKKIERDFTWFL